MVDFEYMRRTAFFNGGIYHIFNRGTEKRNIFLSKKDYERFIINMILFRDEDYLAQNINRFSRSEAESYQVKNPLVDILCFCFMPNHYHLVLRQRKSNGISRYLHRLQMSYSKYFNLLYDRSGNLFQGAYKAVSIEKDNQFHYIPLYVHMNPLELIERNWKKRGVRNLEESLKFLQNYQWSSLASYLDKNSLSYLETKSFNDFYTPEELMEEIKSRCLTPGVEQAVEEMYE
jgi:putative transposase